MLKKNGSNKYEFDKVGTINMGIRLIIYIISGLAVYFNTIGDIKTRQAIISERQGVIIERLTKVECAAHDLQQINSKLDSLIIELRHLK